MSFGSFAVFVVFVACQANLFAQSAAPRQDTAKAAVLRRQQAAARFLAQRGIGAHGKGRSQITPAQALLRARLQHNALKRFSANDASAQQAWTAIGPPQVLTPAYGAVTGRVTSIAADPADTTGNTVYLGTTGGGVWKSVNATAAPANVEFNAVTDTISGLGTQGINSLSIGAVSVQPGGTGVVLAGTGDPNDALDSYYGEGILRSANGGASWTSIINTSDQANGGIINRLFTGMSFAGFAWSTVNSNLVVAAVTESPASAAVNANSAQSQAGLFYSTDGGVTWLTATITDGANAVVQSAGRMPTGGGNPATAIVWNAVRQRFYAAIRYHGYYESADGITFTRLASQPGTNLDAGTCPASLSLACPIYRGALAVQPQTGDTFALTVDSNNLDQGLWQDQCKLASGTCAGMVSFANRIATSALETAAGDTHILQASYDLWLAAVPSGTDTLLFAGTMDIFRCSLGGGCAWRNTTNVNTCAAARVAPAQHAVDATFGASGTIFFGNDGGLWRSGDAVSQQQAICSSYDAAHFGNLNNGLSSLTEIGSFAQDPNDSHTLLAALGAIGTATSVNMSVGWPQILTGNGSGVAIDPANPQNWYATSAGGVSINLCSQGSSCDLAGFGAPAISSAQVSGDGDSLLTPAPWILDTQTSGNLIVGTCRVWRGPGTGAGWTAANAIGPILDGDQAPACNGNAEIRSLAASGTVITPAGGYETLYAGMAGSIDGGGTVPGHLYSATVNAASDATTAWTDLDTSTVTNDSVNGGQFNPGGFAISSIAIDPHDPTGQTVYATVQGLSGNGISAPLLYRSTNGGQSWIAAVVGLPDAPANSVVVDPNDANTVYVALDTGVYVTRAIATCGTTLCWNILGQGLPDAPVTQLGIFASAGKYLLRAGTYGRGIWEIPLVSAPPTTTASLAPTSINFGNQVVQMASGLQTISITNSGSANLTVTSSAITGDFSQFSSCTQVAPTKSCVIQVEFTPTAVGLRQGTLTVFGNVDGGQVTVSLSGTGVAGAAVVLNPASLTFGTELIGSTTAAQNITVSNTGGVSVTLQKPVVTGPFTITANTCTATLAVSSGCTVSVAFAPTASGAQTGTFSIADDPGTQTAQLTGTGQSAATDTISPTSLTFPAVTIGSASTAQLITLTNAGDASLGSISFTEAGDFAVTSACAVSLSGHSSCTFSVKFAPAQVGASTGTLTITDALHTQTVALSGTGLAAPSGIVSPGNANFGDVGVGLTSSPQTFTLNNNGGIDLAGMTFAASGAYTLPGSGNTCTSTLVKGNSCTLQVVFKPTQAGVSSGTLTIASTSLANPITVALTGTGVDFQLQVSGSSSATITSGQTASYQLQLTPVSGSTGTVSFTCAGAPQYSTCTLNPTSLQINGAASGTITVSAATGVSAASTHPVHISWGGGGAVAIVACLLVPVLRSRDRRRWLALAVVVALVLLPTACGTTATGGGSTPPPKNYVTPSGTYTLTVTASSAGLQRTAALTLNVE